MIRPATPLGRARSCQALSAPAPGRHVLDRERAVGGRGREVRVVAHQPRRRAHLRVDVAVAARWPGCAESVQLPPSALYRVEVEPVGARRPRKTLWKIGSSLGKSTTPSGADRQHARVEFLPFNGHRRPLGLARARGSVHVDDHVREIMVAAASALVHQRDLAGNGPGGGGCRGQQARDQPADGGAGHAAAALWWVHSGAV